MAAFVPPPMSLAFAQDKIATVPPFAYENAMMQWAAIPTGTAITLSAASKARTLATGVAGVVWKPIGPDGLTTLLTCTEGDCGTSDAQRVGAITPLSTGASILNGRIGSIAINPNDPNVIYLGATDGGVWKTLDAGNTWTPLTDHQPMIAVGQSNSIAIDPNNTSTLYVGSSLGTSAKGSQGIEYNTTLGIMKSTDAGASWVVLGSGFPAGNRGNARGFAGQNIFAIDVDPADSSDLYLGSNTGLYYSADSGQNWRRGKGSAAGQTVTMAFDASSPPSSRVLFAGIYGVGIQISRNSGRKWTTVLNSATPAVAAQLALHSMTGNPASIGKIAIALAPPARNPSGVQVVYAVIEGTGGNFPITGISYTNLLGVFETTDQGASWTFQSTGPFDPTRGVCDCGGTNTIAVDPGSPGDGVNDIIYWGGTDSWKSLDSGVTFTSITNGMHADSRAWGFAPGTPAVVYAGNDGGIWRSTDGGTTWTGTSGGPPTINTGGLQTGLLYHMDIQRDPGASVTLGAFLDNGQGRSTGSLSWQQTFGSDGVFVVFDQQSLDTAYAKANNGPLLISTDSGGTWTPIANNLPAGQISRFDNSLSVDPNNTGYIYFSGALDRGPPKVPGQLFRSEDFGTTFTKITKFSTKEEVGPSTVSPANSNNLAVAAGSNSASLFISANVLNATPTFTQIPGTPGSQITRLAFDPNDANALYFVTAGFAPKDHVYRVNFRVSGGMLVASTVTDVSPKLNVPFDGLALDGSSSPTTIYAGSDLGVLRSVDGGVTWTTLDAMHFPNAIVTDLQINPTAQVLRASTFGRGVFEFAAAQGPVIAVNPQNNLQFGAVCAGKTVALDLTVYNVGTSALNVNSVQRQLGSSAFSVAPNPSAPVSIAPNAQVDFTVQFKPTTLGPQSATVAIESNDPGAPAAVLTASGRSPGACS